MIDKKIYIIIKKNIVKYILYIIGFQLYFCTDVNYLIFNGS